MPLVPMTHMLRKAVECGYAVGYFESWNLESMLAVIDAAEQMRSPVIIGFNGGFLGNDERPVEVNLYHYGSLGKSVAEHAGIPVALILNEAVKVPLLVKGLKAGFNVIMHDHETCSFEESLAINKYLTSVAHSQDAEVEAEIGQLPALDTETNTLKGGELTDPEQAEYFVRETGVDALAVAVGNVHKLESGKSRLDFELIKALRNAVKVPLVLHGGTGLAEEELRQAIRLGVCKINIGTGLRRAFVNAVKRYLAENNVDKLDPNEVTSTGGKSDMLMQARLSVKEEVVRFMKIFGSPGKADV